MKISKKNMVTTTFGEVAIQQKADIDRNSHAVDRYIAGEHMNSEDLHIRQWGVFNGQYLGPAFRRKFEKGDILYGSRRTYLKKVAVAEFAGITANTTFVIKPNREKIFAGLLPFLMLSDSFTEHSIKHSKGSVNPYINWKDIANYEFKLPPLIDDQKRIADLLWSIDQVEGEYSNLIKTLEKLIASYMNSVLESKKLSKARISEIAKVTAGNSAPQGDKYFNGDKKFVRVQHILSNEVYVSKCDFVNDLAVRECRLKLFPAKTILFPKSGASVYLEKKAMLKESSYVVSHLCAVMVNEEKVMPEYLLYIFKGSRLSKNCAGGYPTIDLSGVKNWEVPLPSMQEQAVIVQRINLLEGLRDKIVIQFKSSTEIKKQIINQIFG